MEISRKTATSFFFSYYAENHTENTQAHRQLGSNQKGSNNSSKSEIKRSQITIAAKCTQWAYLAFFQIPYFVFNYH